MLSAPFCGVHEHVKSDLIHLQRRAREIATAAVVSETPVRRWTHRLDAVLLHPVLGPIILAADHVRDVPGGVRLERGAEVAGSRTASPGSRTWSAGALPAGLAALADRRRRDRRRRRGDHLPAADPDPVLLHPAARRHRLHGPRRLPDGPADARRRPVGPRLHPLAVELRLRGSGDHGDADDRRSQGPADDHPGRAADDLLGAAAGLHADHRRLHPEHAPRPGASACRGW